MSCCFKPRSKHPYISIRDEEMEKVPIGQCSIMSSYRTLEQSSSLQDLYHIFERNYRSIELGIVCDIECYIPHVRLRNVCVPLEECLHVIVRNAWRFTDFPLFVHLHIETQSQAILMDICTLCKVYLREYFTTLDRPLSKCTLGRLRKKVVFSSNVFIPFLPSCTCTDIIHIPCHNGILTKTEQDVLNVFPSKLFRVYPSDAQNYDVQVFKRIHFTPLIHTHEDEYVRLYESIFKGKGIVVRL